MLDTPFLIRFYPATKIYDINGLGNVHFFLPFLSVWILYYCMFYFHE
jgi:hypothetical protein